jgi:hypothetical protein
MESSHLRRGDQNRLITVKSTLSLTRNTRSGAHGDESQSVTTARRTVHGAIESMSVEVEKKGFHTFLSLLT